MLGLTAASVPLYRLFCQVTGYGGTTQVAEAPPASRRPQIIKVRFNADVDPGCPGPSSRRSARSRSGSASRAWPSTAPVNRSDRPVVGRAVYNVTPFKVGIYFDKIACFCFEEQVLQPGEEVDMPVSFFVDPAILDDPNTREVTTITLSYTFFLLEAAARDQPSS